MTSWTVCRCRGRRPEAGSGDKTGVGGRTFPLKRFFLILVLIAIVLFEGLASGYGLFYRLLYILALITGLSYIWNRLSVGSLDVTVDRRSRRVLVGDTVTERITVRNQSMLPKPMLEVQDLTDLPGYSVGMATSLPSKGYRGWNTEAPARKRGAYTLGPVRVANTDAFGLFRSERMFGGTDTLLVYPRTYDLPGFAIPAAYLSGESSARRRTHDLTPHASSVREYASGDSISRVHWNSTARLGKLMSKQFDLGHSSDVWLVVDLQKNIQAGELDESTDEYAVSIAASLAKKYLDAQLPVGLIAYGDKRYFLNSDPGTGQYDRIMELLAMSKAEGTTSLSRLLPREESLWGFHSSVVVITPSHRPDWVVGLKELTRRRVRVAVVLLDGSSFDGIFKTTDVIPELYLAGIPPYVVSRGEDIPSALSRWYTSPELPAAEEMEAPL